MWMKQELLCFFFQIKSVCMCVIKNLTFMKERFGFVKHQLLAPYVLHDKYLFPELTSTLVKGFNGMVSGLSLEGLEIKAESLKQPIKSTWLSPNKFWTQDSGQLVSLQKFHTYFHTSLSGKLALFMDPQDKDNGKQIFFWILIHASLELAGFNL